MENLNYDLKQITYEFIKLFYKTDKKYSCTQTKLGKLISILMFLYARNNKLLIFSKVYKYLDCGTFIKDLNFIPSTIYFRNLDIPDPDGVFVIYDAIKEDTFIPNQYKKFGVLPIILEKDIREVFRRFGAYSTSNLSEYLNPIVDIIVLEDSNELDLDIIKNLDKEKFKGNPIAEFIFSYKVLI